MIHTAIQLKALIRNKSNGDNGKAMTLIRNYIMERFLERVALSEFKDKLILKGGMLVASMVGLDHRATMDIDATLKNYELSVADAVEMVESIIVIEVEDGVSFALKGVDSIMDDFEYPGIRFKLEASLDGMKTPLKLDVSTGDVITPRAIHYNYKLMFEDRIIELLAYNLETVLAEKLETVITRGVTNTRMRDYYDLTILSELMMEQIDSESLRNAISATSKKRGTMDIVVNWSIIVGQISEDVIIEKQWKRYQEKFDYARVYKWVDVISSVVALLSITRVETLY